MGGSGGKGRGGASPRRLRAYLAEALEVIRRSALFAGEVDWEGVRRDADAVLEQARCYADTHALLGEVLHRAGGRHSHLTPPSASSRRPLGPQAAAALGPAVPTGRLITATPTLTGYVRLPRLGDGRDRARRYRAEARAVMAGLVEARPRGWLVDLRADIGGNMWPMLAAVAPLLPDGAVGHFRLPDGRHQPWSVRRDGRISLDGKVMARYRGPRPTDDGTPIAVLVSRHTASAGEAVALAFRAQPRARLIGAPTAGFTTGNRTHVLRDGTRMRVSVAHYADHRRHLVTGPVPVDEHLADNSRAAAVEAALTWLRAP